MKPLRSTITILIAGGLLAGLATAQEPQTQYPEPGEFRIDWERQVVIVSSLGAPNTNLPRPAWRASALRAARQTAYRDLLEAVKGVRVSSTTTVENSMLTSDIIKSSVEGVIRNFVILDTKYYEAMDVAVIVEMPLTGALYDVLLPGESGGRVASAAPAQPQPQPVRASGATSGLIVDATGLDVMPAMAPKIIDEDGNEVYGTTKVLRNFAMTQGIVGYHNNVEGASQAERVVGNPIVIRALRATGANGCDLVVSNADAGAVRRAAANLPFLDECRVMIVLGAEQ
jgi:hypothetical protein